jgi:hypothetical protein
VVCFRGGKAPTRRNLGAASLISFVMVGISPSRLVTVPTPSQTAAGTRAGTTMTPPRPHPTTHWQELHWHDDFDINHDAARTLHGPKKNVGEARRHPRQIALDAGLSASEEEHYAEAVRVCGDGNCHRPWRTSGSTVRALPRLSPAARHTRKSRGKP